MRVFMVVFGGEGGAVCPPRRRNLHHICLFFKHNPYRAAAMHTCPKDFWYNGAESWGFGLSLLDLCTTADV